MLYKLPTYSVSVNTRDSAIKLVAESLPPLNTELPKMAECSLWHFWDQHCEKKFRDFPDGCELALQGDCIEVDTPWVYFEIKKQGVCYKVTIGYNPLYKLAANWNLTPWRKLVD